MNDLNDNNGLNLLGTLLNNKNSTDNNNLDHSNQSNDKENLNPYVNLLIALKPFLNEKKINKLEAYLPLLNFKNLFNIFGGDLFG